MKISFTGHSGHAKLLRERFESHDYLVPHKIFSPTCSVPIQGFKNVEKITDLLDSEIIVIASPSDYHFSQLESLRDFRGYIFMEKPAANTAAEIDALDRIPDTLLSKLYVNFNFIHTRLAVYIRDILKGPDSGVPISFSISSSHGASLGPDKDLKWRLTGGTKLGPLETTGIHYVHMLSCLFGIPSQSVITTSSVSRKPGVDTGSIFLQYNNGLSAHILTSYAAPLDTSFRLVTSNLILEYNGMDCVVYSPRETRDQNGYYIRPPSRLAFVESFSSMWRNSIDRSIDVFLSTVRINETFDYNKTLFDCRAMKIPLDGQRYADHSHGGL